MCEIIIIYFYFVETKGPTLEEIARLFDGDDANVSGKELLDIDHKKQQVEVTENANVQRTE